MKKITPRPPLPSDIDQIRFIVFYALNPCEADFNMYLEVSKEPLGELAVFLVEPDLSDIVQGFFTPKGLRTGRHGRKGRRGGKGVGGIPDLSDEIAKRLPGRGDLETRAISGLGRLGWTVWGHIDRVNWTLAVVDKVSDTAFDSLYGLITADNIKCPNIGRVYRRQIIATILDSDHFNSFPLNILEYAHNIGSTTNAQVNFGTGTYSLSLAGTFRNAVFGDTEVALQLFDPSGGGVVLAQSGFHTVTATGDVTIDVQATVIGPGGVQWRVQSRDDNCEVVNARFFAVQIAE